MVFTAKSVSRAALALALACAALPAQAQPELGLEAGVVVRHSELDLDADGLSLSTDISRLGIALWENAGPWLRLGLEGGPLRLSQNGNPATAGMELSGQYIELSASGNLLTTRRLDLALALAGSLGYGRAEGDRDTQETRLTWYEGRGELAAVVKLFPLHLSGGAFAFVMDGDETASGPLAYTRDVEAESQAGGFIALEYWVDATGRISLRGEAGGRQGFQLLFARRF